MMVDKFFIDQGSPAAQHPVWGKLLPPLLQSVYIYSIQAVLTDRKLPQQGNAHCRLSMGGGVAAGRWIMISATNDLLRSMQPSIAVHYTHK